MKNGTFDRTALRMPAALLLIGQVLYVLVTLLHTGGEANHHSAIFAAYAGSQIWTGWGSAEFSQEAIWAKTMTPVINSGQSVAANLQKWQDAIKNQAQVTGYSVK